MPEIWLNYGSTDVVLDIKAENLEEKIDIDGKTIIDSEIKSKLESLDISKPTEFVILNSSESVRKTLSIILEKYNEKSIPKPSILADRFRKNEDLIVSVARFFKNFSVKSAYIFFDT